MIALRHLRLLSFTTSTTIFLKNNYKRSVNTMAANTNFKLSNLFNVEGKHRTTIMPCIQVSQAI